MRMAQVQKPAPQKTEPADAQRLAEEDAAVQAAQSKDAPEILDEAADWLDEIDAALFGLDQEFVTQFVQLGGE